MEDGYLELPEAETNIDYLLEGLLAESIIDRQKARRKKKTENPEDNAPQPESQIVSMGTNSVLRITCH